jgi:flagellar hook-associated protein 2
MALASSGVGSGLDINNIISQLMALEQRPLTALATTEAKHQAKLSAYGSLKGALSTFQTAVAVLATPSKFTALKTSVADATIATVSGAPTAAAGSYSLEVRTLAQSQKLKSSTFVDVGAAIGIGKLTFSFGTYNADTFTLNPEKASVEVTIAAEQNSLTGIRDAINAAKAGVTAGIVNDGTGYRLTIASNSTGVANAVRITVADDDTTHVDSSGLSQLAFDARTLSGVTNLTQTVEASNALVVIDGISVSKATNAITDAIEGLTINLLKTNTGSPTTLSALRDTAGIQATVQSFVKAYNDLHKTIADLTKVDTETKKGSTLTGDATVRDVQNQLRAAFNKALPAAAGGLTSLADIGIAFQKDGTLKLDAAKLTTVLNNTTKDVSTLFAAVAKPTDPLVSFVTAAADTKNGSYALNITQIATQGKAVGGAAAVLTINAGVNDALAFTIDGVAGSITLAAGIYTADTVAAEIQSKINGVAALSSGGIKVGVTQAAGVLSVTSSRYGAASSVALTGGNAMAGLFGAATETVGLDIAGTMGGIEATGAGQTLTGTGPALGLALKIPGGATGDRGTVSYARGYAYELDKLTSKILETNNSIDNRINGVKSSIDDIGDRRVVLEARLLTIEKRLRAQYSALDALLTRMQSTSASLAQQLANLPTSSNSSRGFRN